VVLINHVCVLPLTATCLGAQVRNRWSELSVDEQQKITQLAYQHMKDGECYWASAAIADWLPHAEQRGKRHFNGLSVKSPRPRP